MRRSSLPRVDIRTFLFYFREGALLLVYPTEHDAVSRDWIASVGSRANSQVRVHKSIYCRSLPRIVMLVIHRYPAKTAQYVTFSLHAYVALLQQPIVYYLAHPNGPNSAKHKSNGQPCTLPFPRGLSLLAGVATSDCPVASTGMVLCTPAAPLAPLVEVGLAFGLLGIKCVLASKYNEGSNQSDTHGREPKIVSNFRNDPYRASTLIHHVHKVAPKQKASTWSKPCSSSNRQRRPGTSTAANAVSGALSAYDMRWLWEACTKQNSIYVYVSFK